METKKILWVRLDAIGDNVLAASMFPHIAEKFPGSSITVVCQQHISELYEASPYVERVIGVDKMRVYLDSKYRNDILQTLQEEKFEIAFDTTFSWDELTDFFVVGSLAEERVAFENQSGIPANIAAKKPHTFTKLIKTGGVYESEMDRYHDFMSGLGIDAPNLNAAIWMNKDDEKFADEVFAVNNLEPEKTIALFAFGRSHLRTYPYYGKAIAAVCRENNLSVIALGDTAAYGFNQSCLNDIGVSSINLSGKTTLRQTAAILKRCRLSLGAETGIAHIACAVGVPNVIVIGGGHFGRFMPYSPLTSLVALPLECYWCDWICKYGRSHCVTDIAPEVVEFAVKETLRSNSERPRLFLHAKTQWNPADAMPPWKMVDKFVTSGNVEIIPVEFTQHFDHIPVSGSELESKLSGYKSKEKPEAVSLALKIATDLREQGKPEEALNVIEKAVEENSAFPDLLNFKAELKLQLGLLEEAKTILWNIIMSVPFDVNAMNNIAVIEIIEKRYDSALGVLQRLLEVEPNNEAALSNLQFINNNLAVQSRLIDAERFIMNKDYEAARSLLNEILEANSAHEDALADLALVETHEGNYDAALKDLQKVLNINPQNGYALQLMEKLLLRE